MGCTQAPSGVLCHPPASLALAAAAAPPSFSPDATVSSSALPAELPPSPKNSPTQRSAAHAAAASLPNRPRAALPSEVPARDRAGRAPAPVNRGCSAPRAAAPGDAEPAAAPRRGPRARRARGLRRSPARRGEVGRGARGAMAAGAGEGRCDAPGAVRQQHALVRRPGLKKKQKMENFSSGE